MNGIAAVLHGTAAAQTHVARHIVMMLTGLLIHWRSKTIQILTRNSGRSLSIPPKSKICRRPNFEQYPVKLDRYQHIVDKFDQRWAEVQARQEQLTKDWGWEPFDESTLSEADIKAINEGVKSKLERRL